MRKRGPLETTLHALPATYSTYEGREEGQGIVLTRVPMFTSGLS